MSDEDKLLEEKEAKAIASVLNAGPIATKDAAALFFLARRAQSIAPFSGLNQAVLAAAAELYDGDDGDGAALDDGGGKSRAVGAETKVDVTETRRQKNKRRQVSPPSMKKLSNHVRQKLGVSLTVRELERVARTVEGRESGEDR